MSELIGQQIGQYRVDALLGEGNMGAVYQAFDLNLSRKVVLKVMNRQLASHESFQQRFMQEAQAAAKLDHPSVIKIYNFDYQPNLYMVMEYVSGPSLGEYVKHQQNYNQVVKLDTILRLVAQVADALDYAHSQGVVHRDVKPSNVLLKPLSRPDREGDPSLRAVVTDFGLAKLLEGGMHTLTGTFMGTLSYMSPEQCLGRDLDGRSDIYSLGIVLYQLTTGQLPFNVKSPTDAIRMHVKEIPPAPRLVRPGLPEGVEQVILTAIAKNPASRYQTASQLSDALRRLAWGLVHPTDTSASFNVDGESGSPLMPSGTIPPTADQLLIYHAAEAPRVMALLDDHITVGRFQDNQVMLPDKGVSRTHVHLNRTEGGWQVTDLNSTNGAFIGKLKLEPHKPEMWPPETELRVGPYSLQWQRAKPKPLIIGPSADDLHEPERQQTNPGEIEMVIDPPQLSAEPGNRTNFQVMLVNRGPIVEHVNLRVEGEIPDSWVSYSEQLVKLMPGGRSFVRATLDVPRNNSALAGSTPFQVTATPMSNPEAAVRCNCSLKIDPFYAFSSSLESGKLENAGNLQVRIINQGNSENSYHIRQGRENTRLVYDLEQDVIVLQPAQERSVKLGIAAVKRPMWGLARHETFVFEVVGENTRAQTVQGDIEIRPIIPIWLFYTLIMLLVAAAVIVALWLSGAMNAKEGLSFLQGALTSQFPGQMV